ncbi:MAG: carboxypeptidase-like regulatory domain-containing protein, partial [Acidobacteriota bacterium]
MSRHSIAILCLLHFFVSPAWSQLTTGTISGAVSDETGGVLPGVEIHVVNTDTGISRTLVT